MAIKERKSDSEIKEIEARAIQLGVSSAFAAMQAGEKIAMVPQIAPIADEVMSSAGYKAPTPYGDDPNYPTANDVVPNQPAFDNQEQGYQAGGLPGDTSPLTPANPDSPIEGANQGIETLRAD